MSSGIPDRKPYRRELYVEREMARREVQVWENGGKRLLTLTGPPAIGKSWFLKHMVEMEFDGDRTIWIDVRQQLSFPDNPATGNGEIDEERQQKWLQEFLNELSSRFDNIPSYDPAVDVTTLLEAAARGITIHNPAQVIYLFVDDGDLASDKSWRQFERTILEPFTRSPSFRFIIALREDQKMQLVPLRWSEERLSLKTLISEKGRQQIKKLVANLTNPLPDVEEILIVLPGYNWAHPGLNRFLFDEAIDGYTPDAPVFLGPNILERGLNSLIPLPENEKPQIVGWLMEVAELEDEWAIDRLVNYFGISNSEAGKRIQNLQDYLLVTNPEQRRSRLKITDGVREFVRAAQAHDQRQMRREE